MATPAAPGGCQGSNKRTIRSIRLKGGPRFSTEDATLKLSAIAIPQRPKGLRFGIDSLAAPHFSADAATGMIEIFDVIGDGGTTPQRISAALRSIGAKPVVVQINSPGGDAFAGLTIFNLLRGHSAPVTTEVLGIAASAASVIAMAGEEIRMAKASQMMIHQAHAFAVGNADVFRQTAGVLDQVDGVTADLYAARTGLTSEQVAALMARETFMTAAEAIDMGFADVLLPRDASPAPQKANASAAETPRDVERQLRNIGYSRTKAARMTAAWAAGGNDEQNQQDLLDPAAIAAACASHTADFSKFLERK